MALTAFGRVRLLSDLAKGDRVLTPLGRVATVKGFLGDRADLDYGDGDDVSLLPRHITLVARAKPHAFPSFFFQGGVAKAMEK